MLPESKLGFYSRRPVRILDIFDCRGYRFQQKKMHLMENWMNKMKMFSKGSTSRKVSEAPNQTNIFSNDLLQLQH